MRVLVTDGEMRSALAVSRSLGRWGCRVVVTAKESRSVGSSSKFCWRAYQVPDPLHDAQKYASIIGEIACREGIQVVVPLTEQSIYLLNQSRERLSLGTVLACPSADKIGAVADKASLCQLAEKLGISMPRTIYLSGPADLPTKIGEIVLYPVVVKPALSKIPEGERFLSAGVKYAGSRAALEHLYATSSVLRFPSMIQEKIIGPGTGLFSLFDVDHHLALFSHRRLLEKPPSGGVSVVSESVPLDEEMVDAAARLLSAVEWTGVAMVEFKRDVRDGRAKLMEVNGRFWGSLQLAIASGIDFPVLLMRYLSGDPMGDRPLQDYKIGLRMKWLLGSLDYLLIRLRNDDGKLNLPPASPTKFQAILDFLKVKPKNTTFDVFDTKDISPFLFECRSYLKSFIRS